RARLLLAALFTSFFGATSQACLVLRLRNTTTHLLGLTAIEHSHDVFLELMSGAKGVAPGDAFPNSNREGSPGAGSRGRRTAGSVSARRCTLDQTRPGHHPIDDAVTQIDDARRGGRACPGVES